MRKSFYSTILLLTLLLLSQNFGYTQTLSIGDPFERYLRLMGTDENIDQLPSFNIRPVYVEGYFENSSLDQTHPWQNHPFFNRSDNGSGIDFHFLAPQLKTTFNSHLPVGQNDGALWQGKGINTQFMGGFTASYGPISASIQPQFVFSQNRDFGLSQFATPDSISIYGKPRRLGGGGIDQPQRFGESAVSTFHPGESWIRLQYYGIAAGISSENIWTGPAYQNPIVFSNNGPGFMHGFIGTYKPVETPIGNFEGRMLGGRLMESDYFDINEKNNKRFINALILNYSPSFVPGLHIGGTRMVQKNYPDGGIGASDFFEVFQPFLKENFVSEDNPSGNLGTHQLLSLFARWVFPSYGMEVYTEWSRNDHSANDDDLLRHFEHARAYMLGLTKKFELSSSRWLTTNIEITQLEVPRLQEFRNTGSYYLNGEVPQGYTHQGQILGAGIGPGSNSQIISANYYHPDGMWGVSLNRIVHNNDALYQLFRRNLVERDPWELNNVEFRLGLHGLRFIDTQNFEIRGDLYWSHILNYDYQYQNDRNNLNLQVSVRYFLPGMVR